MDVGQRDGDSERQAASTATAHFKLQYGRRTDAACLGVWSMLWSVHQCGITYGCDEEHDAGHEIALLGDGEVAVLDVEDDDQRQQRMRMCFPLSPFPSRGAISGI